jgi:fucose 4-O-acetylase-like acetyltransferase
MFSEVRTNSINILYIHRTVDRPQARVACSFQFHTIPSSSSGESYSHIWSLHYDLLLALPASRAFVYFRVVVTTHKAFGFKCSHFCSTCCRLCWHRRAIICNILQGSIQTSTLGQHFTSLHLLVPTATLGCYFQCAEQESPPPPPLIAYLSR